MKEVAEEMKQMLDSTNCDRCEYTQYHRAGCLECVGDRINKVTFSAWSEDAGQECWGCDGEKYDSCVTCQAKNYMRFTKKVHDELYKLLGEENQ